MQRAKLVPTFYKERSERASWFQTEERKMQLCVRVVNKYIHLLFFMGNSRAFSQDDLAGLPNFINLHCQQKLFYPLMNYRTEITGTRILSEAYTIDINLFYFQRLLNRHHVQQGILFIIR